MNIVDAFARFLETAPPLMEYLFDAALKGSVIFAVAGLVAVMLRRSAPSLRHIVWLVAMVAVFVQPLVTAIGPHLPLTPLPGVPRVGTSPAPAATGTVASPRVEPSPALSAPALVPVAEAQTEALQERSVDFWSWLMRVWLCGVLLVAGAWLAQLIRAARVASAGEAIPWSGRCPVRSSRRARVPFVWGLVRAYVVVPATATSWSPELRASVLHHEFAHIQRGDQFSCVLVRIVCALHWFNPLMWYAASRLELESERACDTAVLDAGVRPAEYARQLLSVASSVGSRLRHDGTLAFARTTQVEDRIRVILDPAKKRGSRITRCLAIVALVALIVPAATLEIFAQSDPPATAEWHGTDLGEYAADRLAELGGKDLLAIAKALRTEDWDARKADDGPRLITDGRAVDPLIVALKDPRPIVRRIAAWGLGEIGDPRAVDPLRALLDDYDADVRATAAQSLGDIASRSATEDLIVMLDDSDPDVRLRAAHALGDIRDERSAVALGDALGDENAAVREKAAWALAEIASPLSVQVLVARAGDENESLDMRCGAIRSLGEIGDPEVAPFLIGLLRSGEWRIRSQSADALGDIGAPGSRGALEEATNDSNGHVRANARKALRKVDR